VRKIPIPRIGPVLLKTQARRNRRAPSSLRRANLNQNPGRTFGCTILWSLVLERAKGVGIQGKVKNEAHVSFHCGLALPTTLAATCRLHCTSSSFSPSLSLSLSRPRPYSFSHSFSLTPSSFPPPSLFLPLSPARILPLFFFFVNSRGLSFDADQSSFSDYLYVICESNECQVERRRKKGSRPKRQDAAPNVAERRGAKIAGAELVWNEKKDRRIHGAIAEGCLSQDQWMFRCEQPLFAFSVAIGVGD